MLRSGSKHRSPVGRGHLQPRPCRAASHRRPAGRPRGPPSHLHDGRRDLHRGVTGLRIRAVRCHSHRRRGARRGRSRAHHPGIAGDRCSGVARSCRAGAGAGHLGRLQRPGAGDRPHSRRIPDPALRLAEHLSRGGAHQSRCLDSGRAGNSGISRPRGPPRSMRRSPGSRRDRYACRHAAPLHRALGSELEIVAQFPDHAVKIGNFRDLADKERA